MICFTSCTSFVKKSFSYFLLSKLKGNCRTEKYYSRRGLEEYTPKGDTKAFMSSEGCINIYIWCLV